MHSIWQKGVKMKPKSWAVWTSAETYSCHVDTEQCTQTCWGRLLALQHRRDIDKQYNDRCREIQSYKIYNGVNCTWADVFSSAPVHLLLQLHSGKCWVRLCKRIRRLEFKLLLHDRPWVWQTSHTPSLYSVSDTNLFMDFSSQGSTGYKKPKGVFSAQCTPLSILSFYVPDTTWVHPSAPSRHRTILYLWKNVLSINTCLT